MTAPAKELVGKTKVLQESLDRLVKVVFEKIDMQPGILPIVACNYLIDCLQEKLKSLVSEKE